jgi:hypothetical protein
MKTHTTVNRGIVAGHSGKPDWSENNKLAQPVAYAAERQIGEAMIGHVMRWHHQADTLALVDLGCVVAVYCAFK